MTSLVEWGKAPRSKSDRLKLIQAMVKHSQSCKPGDSTLEAAVKAIADVASKPADEYFTFVLSDADLQRYDVSPAQLGAVLTSNKHVNAFALFISSNFDEAERTRQALPPGHGFSCYDTSELTRTLMEVFQASITRWC